MDAIAKLVFPAAIAWNMFASTGLLIVLGLTGRSELAAEVGVAQAATVLIFMTFSGNARNLILRGTPGVAAQHLFRFRAVLLPLLAVVAFALARGVVAVPAWLALAMVLRRSAEWLAELQISEREQADDRPFALRFCGFQIGWWSALVVAAQVDESILLQGIFVAWSLSPLIHSGPHLRRMLAAADAEPFRMAALMPHLGSSWVIATSTYAFRIMLVLLAGKDEAGLLFSAYAVGGMVCSLFTQALGPSLVSIGASEASRRMRQLTWAAVVALVSIGTAVLVLTPPGFGPGSGLLVTAAGFSLIGGGIMTLAQMKRIIMLQVENRSVFVPDVLANILLIATVPFAFYLLRDDGLVVLFLWSAILNGVFYYLTAASFRRALAAGWARALGALGLTGEGQVLQSLLMFLFFLPLSFQLSGNIFQAPDMVFDSQGRLSLLPLPLAVPACFLGLIMVLRERVVGRTVTTLFLAFILMLLTTFLVADDLNKDLLGKIILLCQVILPWFALPLGRCYREPERWRLRLEGVLLAVLMSIVPLQLLATWWQGTGFLTPYLYWFSIYQHLQYIPVLFVGFFFLSTAALAERRESRPWLLGLSPFLGAYAAASASTLALLLTATGCATVLLARLGGWRFAAALALMCIAGLLAYAWVLHDNPFILQKFQYLLQAKGGGAVLSIHERWYYWRLYLDGLMDGPRTFLLGHEQRFPRELAPSAHNYFLDMAYNFGVVSLLPLLYLFVHTCIKVYRRLRVGEFSVALGGHALLWLFFVLVDNSLKVGLRQPYPGMVVFFLWGVLLSRLATTEERSVQRADRSVGL